MAAGSFCAGSPCATWNVLELQLTVESVALADFEFVRLLYDAMDRSSKVGTSGMECCANDSSIGLVQITPTPGR